MSKHSFKEGKYVCNLYCNTRRDFEMEIVMVGTKSKLEDKRAVKD